MGEADGLRGRVERATNRLVRNVLPRTPDFGPLLTDQTDLVVDVLLALVHHLDQGDAASAERVSALEKAGDRLRERNVQILSRAFSTTFDRDLTAVAIQRIDDVANYAKTTVREMQVLDLAPDDAMRAMARELLAGGRALRDAAIALTTGTGDVERLVGVVHKHERQIEKRYRATIAELFPADPAVLLRDAPGDPLEHALGHLLGAIRRREVYRHLSNAADRLDAAGRVLREIAIATV
jgi:uncharacterized protein Yka (UPF0111/DUF47 family)